MDRLAYETKSVEYGGGAFFRLEETHTTSSVGTNVFVRHVVRHPGGSLVVPILGDSAVCVEQYRPAVQQILLELPGGRPKSGESPQQTAERELFEETGLRSTSIAPLADLYLAPCFCDGLVHLFVARGLRRAVRDSSEEELPTTLRYVNLDKIETMVQNGGLRDAKTILGLLMARTYVRAR